MEDDGTTKTFDIARELGRECGDARVVVVRTVFIHRATHTRTVCLFYFTLFAASCSLALPFF
jgi:hypothetical protein